MSYYTERHGMRKPVEKTYIVSMDMYTLLFDCCARFFDNIAWKYPDQCPDGNGCCGLNMESFSAAMTFEIPSLFKNNSGIVDKPQNVYYGVDKYDQYALFDFIEFMYANCKDVSYRWWHSYYNHNDIRFDKKARASSDVFRSQINGIFEITGLLYHLAESGMVERVTEHSVLSERIEQIINGIKESGLRELLDSVILAYKTPQPSARKDAVDKIWDAFERLKSYYAKSKDDKKKSIDRIITDISCGDEVFYKLLNDEFHVLTNDIGNRYNIRHSEVYQIKITDERYYDYFFNRCLSLIAFAAQYLDAQENDSPGGEHDELPF